MSERTVTGTSAEHNHGHGPMPVERAPHLLNPLRALILSPGALAKRLDLHDDSRVLELGPGPGYFSPEIARRVPQGKLVLVDVQQGMLDMAKKRLDKQRLFNVEYLLADAVSIPLPSESFDVAFMVAVLGEVSDRRRCLRELYRLLRPRGQLSDTEQPGDMDYAPMPVNKALIEGEGFLFEKAYGRGKNYTVNFRKP